MRIITGLGYKTKSVAELWRRGWHEIPEVMAGGVIALIGVGMGLCGAYKYVQRDGNFATYRMSYVVYRPDDPDVAHIKEGEGPRPE